MSVPVDHFTQNLKKIVTDLKVRPRPARAPAASCMNKHPWLALRRWHSCPDLACRGQQRPGGRMDSKIHRAAWPRAIHPQDAGVWNVMLVTPPPVDDGKRAASTPGVRRCWAQGSVEVAPCGRACLPHLAAMARALSCSRQLRMHL